MLNINGKPYYLRNLDNKRVRCGLLSYMCKNNYRPNVNFIHDNSDTFLKKVSDFANYLLPKNTFGLNEVNQKSSEDIIKDLILQVESDLIPLSCFDWLKDDRACYYTWLTIQNYSQRQGRSNPPFYPYNNMELPTTTSNTKERLDCIISFFDLWVIPKNEKIHYLEQIKNDFSRDLELHPFKGLNKKDTEQCQWYYDYITEYFNKNSQVVTDIGRLALKIKPISDEERYQLIYALYDTWGFVFSNKKEFKDKLSKAYSQRKFRKKNEDKKPLNTYLTKETKDKLEKLRAHYNNKTLHDTLDVIIRQVYEQTIK